MSDGVRAPIPFKKAPNDERTWAFVFEDAIELPAGTTIASVDSVAVTSDDEDPVTLTVTGESVAALAFTDDDGETVPANKAVKATVAGGTLNANYLIAITVTLSTGEAIEGTFSVFVRR